MRYLILSLLSLPLLALASYSLEDTNLRFQPRNCRCQNANWCKPIRGRSSSKEVIGFTYGGSTKYQMFDWKRLTTVVIFSITPVTPNIVCMAHKNNVRVQLLVRCNTKEVANSTFRNDFIKQKIKQVQDYHLDGVNVDFEDFVTRNGVGYNGLTELVRNFRTALSRVNRHSVLSMDYVYCPFCSSRRTYDIMTLRHYIDYFILMDYDMQGTMYDFYSGKSNLCSQLENSPLPVVVNGIKQFIRAGISKSQLVPAYPWYGYNDPCNSVDPVTKKCFTDCNNRWKGRFTLRFCKVMSLLRSNANIKRQWNVRASTPFFNYLHSDGRTYQVNYDDPYSLSLKYNVTANYQLRGIGMWNIDYLDYTNDANGTMDRQRMWGIIPNFK